MSFDEKIAGLMQRIPKLVGSLATEEATKTALIMPFIQALGYDVFNPHEVVPEFVADVGVKKGEKVDYAILRDGEVIILIECKKAGVDLNKDSKEEMSQLYRYFSVTKARIAILTNGVKYQLFSDLEDANKMDRRPFLELDLTDPRPEGLAEVKKLAKEAFDLDRMLSSANELKYTSEIKKVLMAQHEAPEEEIVRFFFQKANPGARFTAALKEQFTPLVSRAFSQFIADKVSDRLRTALQQSEQRPETPGGAPVTPDAAAPIVETGADVVTTEDEMEGFHIVRAILCKEVSLKRIVARDAKTYMAVLFDDNNRKPICRLWFNSKQKYLGLFDAEKAEARMPIDDVAGIYEHADQLITTVRRYLS
jgi:hypothetical protein